MTHAQTLLGEMLIVKGLAFCKFSKRLWLRIVLKEVSEVEKAAQYHNY